MINLIKDKIHKRIINLFKKKRITYLLILVCIILPLSLKLNSINGQLVKYTNEFFNKVGMNIEKVKIEGMQRVKGDQVIDVLGISKNTSIVLFNSKFANLKLDEIDWVYKSEIKKLYPSTIQIKIFEYEPVAIWFYNGRKYLVGKKGEIIEGIDADNFKNLKIFAGHNAVKNIPSVIDKLENYPELGNQIKSLLWVGDRRWTLRLFNGMTIHLPEDNFNSALNELVKINQETRILNRYIEVIDMRIPNRIDILPSEDLALSKIQKSI